jgi:hypothetical protein
MSVFSWNTFFQCGHQVGHLEQCDACIVDSKLHNHGKKKKDIKLIRFGL